MKKNKFLIFISILGVSTGLSACSSKTSSQSKPTSKSSTVEVKKHSSEENTSKSTTIASVLADFGKDWLNYSSTNQRNKIVKPLLTDKVIKDHGINVLQHDNDKSTGRIFHIYQELDKPQEYVLVGKQRMNKINYKPLIRVAVTKQGNTYKISKIYEEVIKDYFSY